ncbi:hypothetical protein [Streptomyces hokutonensis]|uniref:Uncharacterized protein n=1 Tax=Streptomyces hokutonensis TaxID=1306990 RepID=A0ABW6MI83_9ACTN
MSDGNASCSYELAATRTQEVQMLYQSPADFCAEYAKANNAGKTDVFGAEFTLETVTVVSETPDRARVEALWFLCGHDPDSGYYDASERIAFVLVKRSDGWRLHSEENLGYE